MSQRPNETEEQYEHRLHVEAEAAIAELLGEEPHAMTRKEVATLKPYLGAVDWNSEIMDGWVRMPMYAEWRHKSGCVIQDHEIKFARNPMQVIVRRLHEHLNKNHYPCSPREIKL